VKIYFAGAIRGGREDASRYLEIVKRLAEHGEVLTEHIADPNLSGAGELHNNRFIHDRDLLWLKEAECLVAEVTTPSLGVGYEIAKATEWGKRVLCLFRPAAGRKLSAMVAGSTGVTVREYQSADDVDQILIDFFQHRE